MRVKFLLGQTHAEKPYGVHHRVLLWCICARCVRIVQAQGRILLEHYSTDVKMFKKYITTTLAAYRPCRRRAAQTKASRTVRYYCCCGYLQEIYTDRTACMSKNLQAPGITVQLVQTPGCYANPLQSRRSCYGKAFTTRHDA